MRRSATISSDGRYRYLLEREWDTGVLGDKRYVLWIMLNPSTADGEVDDPTIRKCMGFTKQWGYRHLHVVNLFAYRATNPKDLLTLEKKWPLTDPVGPDNDGHIRLQAADAAMLVAAWGTNGSHLQRDRSLIEDVLIGESVFHLGLTKDGQPKHPLYVPYSTAPERWSR